MNSEMHLEAVMSVFKDAGGDGRANLLAVIERLC